MLFKKSLNARSSHVDALFISGLFFLVLFLFRQHLFGQGTFIGNSDRLDGFLSILRFQVEQIVSGTLSAWNSSIFGGVNTAAIIGAPIYLSSFLAAIGGSDNAIFLSGIISAGMLFIAGVVAYFYIKDTLHSQYFAFIGSVLYMFSSLVILTISQNDSTFLILICYTTLLLTIRKITSHNLSFSFVTMTIVMVLMLGFGFLQTAAYAMLGAVLYAIYHTIYKKKIWPLLIVIMASIVSIICCFPRIWTIAEEMPLIQRKGDVIGDSFSVLYNFQNILPREFFRLFDVGIFGGYEAQAGQIGNNFNYTEGMLLYTSSLAIFILLIGIIRFRGQWFRLFLFKDGDLAFHLLMVLLGIGVIVSQPLLHFVYLLFLKMDFTHARIQAIVILPLCTLLVAILQSWIGKESNLTHRGFFLALPFSAIIVYFGLFFSQNLSNNLVLLEQRPIGFIKAIFDVSRNKTPGIMPGPVSYFKITRFAHETNLEWSNNDQISFDYFVKLKGRNSNQEFSFGPFKGKSAVLNDLPKIEQAAMSIIACWKSKCSNPVYVGLPHVIGTSTQVGSLKAHSTTWLMGSKIKKIIFYLSVFIIIVVLLLFVHSEKAKYFLVGLLSWICIGDAILVSDFITNGPQTGYKNRPFYGGNRVIGREHEYANPPSAELNSVKNTLETEKYRTALACTENFHRFCATHVASLWRLRVMEGYAGPGRPKYLAMLPWPSGTQELRTIAIPDMHFLPEWKMLSLMNVKYVVEVNDAMYRGGIIKSDGSWRFTNANDLKIHRNPYLVIPRVYFANTIIRVENAREALENIFNSSKYTVLEKSFSEKIPNNIESPIKNGENEKINAVFSGDKIDITFKPEKYTRFLILNELYHPKWRATVNGKITRIYPTNVFMRGIVIPPEASRVSLEFRPFVKTFSAKIFYLSGILLIIILGTILHCRYERH